MINPKRIRFVLICLLILELISGIEWGIHRGLSSLFAQQILSISSYMQIGYIVSIFGLSKAITNLLFGAISDRIGRKPVIVFGIILTGLGGALIGSATEYASMLIGTALIGVGGGATFVGIMVSMTEILPLQIGLAMGLFELAAYGGSSIGTYFGGGFSINYDVRYPFYFFGVLSIIGAALTLLLLPETNTKKQMGTSLYITPKRVGQDFIKIAPICIGGFSSKVLDSLVISFLPLYLVGLQLSLDSVALVLTSYTLSWAILQPVTGHLSDRIGRKKITLIGLAFSSITMIAFTLTIDYIFLVLLALLLGVEAALFYTPLVAMVSDIAPHEVEGTLIGSYRFFRDMGYFLGPIILGEIADSYGLNYSIYMTSAIIVLASFILGFFLKETNPKISKHQPGFS
jgi:MFS family permease